MDYKKAFLNLKDWAENRLLNISERYDVNMPLEDFHKDQSKAFTLNGLLTRIEHLEEEIDQTKEDVEAFENFLDNLSFPGVIGSRKEQELKEAFIAGRRSKNVSK